MTNQQIFDNFYKTVNGHGRSVDIHGGCLYKPSNGHPGCAIGCQPRFKEVFLDTPVENHRVQDLPDFLLERLFGKGYDIGFLAAIQKLHDYEYNWQGHDISQNDRFFLKSKIVREFCHKWNLKCPEDAIDVSN